VYIHLNDIYLKLNPFIEGCNLMEPYAVKAIESIIDVEGGYVDDPDDLGGETNYGITKRVAKKFERLWERFEWDGDMKTMPKAFAMEVYRLAYWDSLELDELSDYSEDLAYKLFDIGVNCGVSRAAEWFQRILNVNNRQGEIYADITTDGDIGPATLRAFSLFHNARGDHGLDVLTVALTCMQGYHYINICEKRERNETFAFGWLDNRVFKELKHFTGK
jgi:lysozyme family protein